MIWWLILGALLIGFAIMDGFDLGVGATFRFMGRTDEERRALLESIEPVWDGNQVWFILAGGAVFAAWPLLYAASFSGLYLAMFVLLVALILRPVGFLYRNKILDARWRNAWDWALFLGGAVPALLFGVAFGSLFLGLPFHFGALARRAGAAFISSCLAVSATILTAGIALFPFLMPSATHPDQGLTIWDASSSARTLFIMLCAVVVILPVVLAYTAWVFHVLKGRITLEEIRRHTGVY